MRRRTVSTFVGVVAAAALLACSTGSSTNDSDTNAAPDSGNANSTHSPTDITNAPSAGNPDGACDIPKEAGPEDISAPQTVVGSGTPESCTGAAFVKAVAAGGVITFNCGNDPTTITLTETAKVYNDAAPRVVIDGGGKVTLSGGGKVRILYQNTCSEELHGGAGCNDKEEPALTLQNITLIDGNAKEIADDDNAGGGGAVWVRGGRFKAVNARFFGNEGAELGSNVAGGAVRVLDFPSKGTSKTRPVYIVNSTFGGDSAHANRCANGGAIGSIGASWTILNSYFDGNQAVGNGASDGEGGNGGAIYNDGNTIALSLCGTLIENNHANEGGSAIFFVSNDGSGALSIDRSTLHNNPRGQFETPGYPGIFVKPKEAAEVTASTLD